MSVIKADDVAYVRFRAPDLDLMHQFLLDFGMVDAKIEADRLFMRGFGTSPFLHATERGEPGFAGFAFWAKSEQDLHTIAEHEGAAIEDLDAPGGGKLARLRDPDGYTVEVVFGQERIAATEMPPRGPWNERGTYRRQNQFRRVAEGPSHVQRLGHVVLGVSNFRQSEAWYKDRFGMVTSDEIQPAPGVAIAAFLRCDRGDQACDHHTVFLVERPTRVGYMHSAFEVADFDDLMAGHDFLKTKQYGHRWGIGRHTLGSQVFDYWQDPWGHEIEHWTDGDRLLAEDGGGIAGLKELLGVQWGDPIPPVPEAQQAS